MLRRIDMVWQACYEYLPADECFSFVDMLLACHKLYPNEFGLKGYEHYPDARILWNLMFTPKGLIKLGVIVKFRGSEQNFRLGQNPASFSVPNGRPPAKDTNKTVALLWIEQCLAHKAAIKLAEGKEAWYRITAIDLMQFFECKKISDFDTNIKAMKTKIKHIEEMDSVQSGVPTAILNAFRNTTDLLAQIAKKPKMRL